jgi:3-polyprenyl-4-hydroxybenzoate decarboxylase
MALLLRETPLHIGHLRTMVAVTESRPEDAKADASQD